MTDDAQRAVEIALLEVTRHWADTVGVPQQVIVTAVENVLASERRVQEKQP